MNRQQRRAAQRQARKGHNTAKDFYGADVDLTTMSQGWDGAIPNDIKCDIAKIVRSIDWDIGTPGGKCFFRALSGWFTLRFLEIPVKLALGGMIYRTGPDEYRDVVSFCGAGNVGRKTPNALLAHYFIISGSDIVDFSVGDWKEDSTTIPDVVVPGLKPLGPIQWTVSPPQFFWADHSNFAPSPTARTPDLGCAWYNGFADTPPDFDAMIEDAADSLKSTVPHIKKSVEFWALKERLFAVRNGHTAVRLSQLAKLVGDPVLMTQARQRDQLFVLRGKQNVTPDTARELLAEAGLSSR